MSGLGAVSAATTSQCSSCRHSERGYYHVDGVLWLSNYHPPNFCHARGKPYPWTATRMHAATELADQLEELTAHDRERLKRSIKDLAVDGPRTELASFVYKKTLGKVVTAAGQALNGILVSIASAAAKKFHGL